MCKCDYICYNVQPLKYIFTGNLRVNNIYQEYLIFLVRLDLAETENFLFPPCFREAKNMRNLFRCHVYRVPVFISKCYFLKCPIKGD